MILKPTSFLQKLCKHLHGFCFSSFPSSDFPSHLPVTSTHTSLHTCWHTHVCAWFKKLENATITCFIYFKSSYKHNLDKYEVPLLQIIKIRAESYSNKAILLKAFIHSDIPLKMKFIVLANTDFRFKKW